MKIVLTDKEVLDILLDAVKAKYGDAFRQALGISYGTEYVIGWDSGFYNSEISFTTQEQPSVKTPE